MTIYEYIAVNNPTQAERLIRRFGYESLRGSDLGDNLREVVAQEGEEALRFWNCILTETFLSKFLQPKKKRNLVVVPKENAVANQSRNI